MPIRPPIYRPQSRSRAAARKDQDQARTREQPWRRWYWTARWRRLAKQQLAIEPLCRTCAQAGQVTPASVCDHVVPHKGDPELFWNGERQSLCKPCHDGAKQALERGRGRVQVGLDGYPIAGRGRVESSKPFAPAPAPKSFIRTVN